MSRTISPTGRRKRPRRTALTACALMLAAAGTGTALTGTASAAPAAAGCTADYAVQNQWDTGFTANVTVTNTGDALSSWNVGWTFSGNQKVTQGWNADITQSGATVTAASPSWGGALGSGGTASFGFQATFSGTNAVPGTITLNGVTCTTDGGGPGDPGDPGDPGEPSDPPGDRVDNPFEGAKVYVNPDWSAQAARSGGEAIADQPTAVWLDRISAIESGSAGENTMGLRDHLDAALEQDADVFQMVTYNLPGRDCAALASQGELGPTEIDRYKNEFIDPIAEILADPKYAGIRIVNTIEIDSLPNLITNVGGRATATENCDVMKENGNYVKGVGYALATFGDIGNVYNYIDIGHHGWIGWDDNFGATAELLHEAATTEGATVDDVAGFAANVANYGAIEEPYFSIDESVNGQMVRQSAWVDWNRYVDIQTFSQAFREEAVSAGFNAEVGVVIDTSRNGWGGPDRPTGPAEKTTVDEYVNGSRVDRRIHQGNWCNQAGAGLGERPTAAPAPGIDAYAWIKPPGESDGASQEIDNDEGKGFDRMCDPTYEGNARNLNNPSGALPDAPVSGHWFQAQFEELLANAYPPL
ncbi:glycoside hydrolase family 6 protein [Streptomyces sp. F63]|uniref:glycoside hydrolase family 6 protein n=1 Tax=Streptomyces sp. F63 TaxID=2824887 RepID=UPI001B36B2A4|nr:glycoside hydrolase family 6 protein [Streptomyces sp. F63]MBQ0983606.1 glycoside hydrolase family 6 protein [Streptomyces sp. F63]